MAKKNIDEHDEAFDPEANDLGAEDVNKTTKGLREKLSKGREDIRKAIQARVQSVSETIAGPIAH